VGRCIRRGIQLVEGVHDEPVDAQHADSLAVAGVELDSAAWPFHPMQAPLRPHEALLGEAFLCRHSEGGQDAVGHVDQPPTRAQQPGRLRHPVIRITPHAGPVLADHQIEALINHMGDAEGPSRVTGQLSEIVRFWTIAPPRSSPPDRRPEPVSEINVAQPLQS
jgi:hypothetical protein